MDTNHDTTEMRPPPDADPPAKPWYRYGWVWLVLIPPAWGVFAGLSLLYIAVSSPNPMVVDDYARIARHTELRMERDREAARLGLSGEITVHAARGGADHRRIELALDSGRAAVPPMLNLRLLHPTRDTLDRTVSMRWNGGTYAAMIEALPAGRYYLLLEPPERNWRLKGQLGAPGDAVRLAPPRDAHMQSE